MKKMIVLFLIISMVICTFIPIVTVVAEESKGFSANFSFGFAKEGYTKINPKAFYSQKQGYGFDSETRVSEGKGYIYGTESVKFNIDVPAGDYKVYVVSGASDRETKMAVLINGGTRIRTYALEKGKFNDPALICEVAADDKKIYLDFVGEAINICSIQIVPVAPRLKGDRPTIYIASDSTAQGYKDSDAPQAGWGQYLQKFFNTRDVLIANRAIGGRSTKNFYNEGRLDSILVNAKPGDYMIVQFGHNDGASSNADRYAPPELFTQLLEEKYIGEALKRGIIPIMATHTIGRWFGADGTIGGGSTYCDLTKEAADKYKLTLLDINSKMVEWLNPVGAEDAKQFYLHAQPGDYPKFPNGVADNTHLSHKGALEVARIAATEIKAKIPALAPFVKKDPNSPDVTPTPVPTQAPDPTVTPVAKTFDDIKTHWAKVYIEKMATNGIVNGVSDTIFSPDAEITRVQFVAMVLRSMGTSPTKHTQTFKDIDTGSWYADTVQSAKDNKIIDVALVSDGNFYPNKPITREEMSAIMISAFNAITKDKNNIVPQETIDMSKFSDYASINPWCKDFMTQAVNRKLITGKTTGGDGARLDPTGKATRAEAATILSRFCELVAQYK